MSSAKATTPKGGMRKAKGTRPATRQRTGQLPVPQQILEGLREMAEFATSGEPPEKRYTVRQLDPSARKEKFWLRVWCADPDGFESGPGSLVTCQGGNETVFW